MDKKILYLLPLALVLSLIFSVGTARAAGEPAQCGINVMNISDGVNGPTITGTATSINWTVTMATVNSSILNVTSITITKNNTGQILCTNLSRVINSTTRGNCTFDSTALVDDDAFTLVVSANETNRTGGVEQCTNLTFQTGVNINNTAPTLTGAAANAKTFTGLLGAAVDNLSIIVDNATRNCTLTIGTSVGGSQQLTKVITKSANAANCTYQVLSTDLPDGSYNVRWSAFDGLDTRFVDNFYTFNLKFGKNSQPPQVDANIVSQVDAKVKSKNVTAMVFVLLLLAAVVFLRKK